MFIVPRSTAGYVINCRLYASMRKNFYKSKIKTNAGKQSLSYMAIDIWKDLPSSLKDLSVLVFPKSYIKRYLLSEQKLNQFFT